MNSTVICMREDTCVEDIMKKYSVLDVGGKFQIANQVGAENPIYTVHAGLHYGCLKVTGAM